jgi:hypothetical protein
MTNIVVIITIYGTINNDEHVKRHKYVSLLTKRAIYFISITDFIKISLFDLDDK